MKFRVEKECDYVSGYLRYGHKETIIEAENIEDAKEKANNIDWYEEELVIDDYEVDDYELSDSEPKVYEEA